MDLSEKQLRVTSCVDTIIHIHSSLAQGRANQALARKLDELKLSLKVMDFDLISVRDVALVETAANRLLNELFLIFPDHENGPIYSGLLH